MNHSRFVTYGKDKDARRVAFQAFGELSVFLVECN